ncbi:hypothetical protein DCF83_13435 [Edwardsiella tarda]|uniref:hypothetical protein n=1 Tax=Edwardsiella tarda TaxID=636 RepID=UPI0011B24C17|nr:hypothetical protein [Edwardsiella tarda]UCQ27029.1 hypothetical protein DCF83_13435 [Edwardsiella tarda]
MGFCISDSGKKSTAIGGATKSLWTDRVNVQEVKNGRAYATAMSDNASDNLQTQHHNHKAKSIPETIHSCFFVPAWEVAATIGICWSILNGQIIMARIKKTNMLQIGWQIVTI